MTSNTSPAKTAEYGLIRAHGYAAVVTLLVSVLFGLLVSIKMHHPDFATTEPWLTWGRLRYNHTQGIFFGWLGNIFWMFLYYAVPKLGPRPVLSKHLGWCLFWLWNFAVVLPGWLLVLAGISQPLEWGEFPLIVDAFVVLSFVIALAQFVAPLVRANLSMLYVSGWYIIGGLIFTLLAYPIGNVVPQLVPGAQGAAFSGLWIHDAIGLYVTPLVLAMAYFVIPMSTRRPIYSHFLSMIGFWLLFFTYPLNGTHHYVFSAIPMDAQQGAIVASVFLGVDVTLVVTNLLLSLRASAAERQADTALRYVWMGVIIYLIVSIQGSLQALMPVNKLVHFSDWVIGHSHLAMLGFASFIGIGGMMHIWQRLPGVRFNRSLFAWSYWLLLVGMIAMVSILTVAGLLEAHTWASSLPWLDSVREVKSYWLARTFAAVPVIAGFLCLLFSMTTGTVVAATVDIAPDITDVAPGFEDETAHETVAADKALSPWLNMAYLSASVAGLGFFLFSFAILGIVPGLALEKEISRTKPATMLPPTAQEALGRTVYAREGCAYCHTQQVRVLPADAQRFGAPTKAWETEYDYPQLWGTRRIGPDLAREAGLRSDDWHLTHLFNPRYVVADSNMPAYPWLFDGSPSKPSEEGRALLAYVKSLGRSRQLAGDYPAQWTPAPQCGCPEDVKKLESSPTALDVNSAGQRRSGGSMLVSVPSDPTLLATEVARGSSVYAQNCATCHGGDAKGDGPAAASLLPKPADLTSGRNSISRLATVIVDGIPGSAMPAWRDLPQRDLESLVAFLKSLEKPSNDAQLSASDAAHAQKVFQANCSSCHGTTGDGNGPASGGLLVCPTNFKTEQPAKEEIADALNNGVAGTSMPTWKEQLSEADRKLLAGYVRSLYTGD